MSLTELELLEHIDPSRLDYQDCKTYSVYVHINKINGKKYVGITKQPVLRRWRGGKGYRENKYFYNSIKKYGWDSFEHCVVAMGLSVEEAEKMEQGLISKYNSNNFRNGYNKTTGGETNKEYSEETRKKISDSRKGKYKGKDNPNYGKHPSDEARETMRFNNKGIKNPFYGKKHSEEWRQKLSELNKGENHPNYGKRLPEETRRKMSEARTGIKHPRAKRVICLTTGMIFNTVTEAATEYVISGTSSICMCCSSESRRKTAGKHPITREPLRWAYCDGKEEKKNGR